ncbi:MAG: TRAP transporter substrate-binding protein [Acidobacteria bacterium]|nr:TRAP transporter substrate-binding protein [Acidobacteriota bacterium]
MRKVITRRSFLAGATAGTASIFVPRAAATRDHARLDEAAMQQSRAPMHFAQYHNQAANSSLHKRLTEMWSAVRAETGGKVGADVFALNNNLPGSDPAALKMLMSGEIQFFTLMGGVLGAAVPVAAIQQVPFAFRTAPQAHQAMDGPLGAYIVQEMAVKGIHGFAVGALDNGMRQMTTVAKPIVVPAHLQGMKMRVPASVMFNDVFKALGCVPVTVNSIDIHAALKSGKVDAQENPLAVVDGFKLYEVVKYVSMTNHMWSSFNQMAHLPTWQSLPADVRQVIDRNVTKAARAQRADQAAANGRLRAELTKRGLVFNDVDQAPFRKQLSGFYRTWKGELGTKAWSLLEQASGASLA